MFISLNFKKYLLIFSAIIYVAAADPVVLFAAESVHDHEAKPAAKYYCPMHPQVVSDKPGECPICHMRLVLDNPSNEKGPAAVEGRIPVSISEADRAALGIQTAVAETRPLEKIVEAWGRVAHDPELYSLQIDFLREEALNFQRERSRDILYQGRGLTARDKIAIQFYDMGLSQEWIEALVKQGLPDKRLLYHHSAGGVWVYLELRENDAALIKSADPVTLSVPALQETKFESKIEFIDTKVNDETGTIRVRVLIADPPPDLKPHMAVTASMRVVLGKSVTVPEDAPLFTGGRAIVFVDQEGTFKPREVTLGVQAGGYFEVKEGLMPGEKVASGGNFFIDSESRLRSAVQNSVHESHTS